jgi:hypothetical protein
LKEGDLLPINTYDRDQLIKSGLIGTYDQGFLIGWLYGDGSLTKRSDTGKYVANFIVSKKDGKHILDKLLSTIKEIDGVDRKVNDRGSTWEFQVGSLGFITWAMEVMSVNKKSKGLPKGIWLTWNEWCRAGFIDGLFSSDGHVPKDNHGISLTSSKLNLIKDMQDLLGFYGIKSKLQSRKTKNNFGKGKVYSSYTLRTYLSGRKKFRELFNLQVEYKQKELDNEITYSNNKNTITQKHVVLKSIKLTELKEDVWDIGVKDETHCFHLPQVTTGNCHEISLRPFTFCNLTEINAGDVKNQEDFNERSKVGAFFGTLQAGFTDFHYLRPIWKQNTEKDSLVGVGITGVANGNLENLNLEESANESKLENLRISKILGINNAARTTTIKPAGTTSCVVGTSSGIHAWHSKFYIRNMQCTIGDDLYNYFQKNHPEIIKDMDFQPGSAVIGIPMKAPSIAIMRDEESAIDFLERVKKYNLDWVKNGHVSGPNKNNVSATVNISSDEWEDVGHWMWINRKTYSGISVMPFDGGTYSDTPFQECSEYEYNKRIKYIRQNPIKLTKIKEAQDNTNLRGELACAGGSCEIIF